jgi:hypothetical protein
VNDVDAAPSERGAVLLAATIGRKYTEVILETDRTFTVARDKERGHSLYRRKLSETDAKKLIEKMLGEPWNTSGGSIRASSSPSTGGLGVVRFVTGGADSRRWSHLWIANASKEQALPYASMR